MIAVDLGCSPHAFESSRILVQRFGPDRLYGFDPHPSVEPAEFEIDGVPCIVEQKAAWIDDSMVTFIPDGVASTILHRGEPCLPEHMWLNPEPRIVVQAFDFEQWLLEHDGPFVVKMDIEGAEYPLLNYLLLQDYGIWKIQYLLVEWHAQERRRERLLERLPMTVEDWAH